MISMGDGLFWIHHTLKSLYSASWGFNHLAKSQHKLLEYFTYQTQTTHMHPSLILFFVVVVAWVNEEQ